MRSSNGPQGVSWQRIALITLCVVLAVVLFVLLFATAYIHDLLNLITVENAISESTLSWEEAATATDIQEYDPTFTGPSVGHEDITLGTLPSTPNEDLEVEGVINIMLIGEDRRPGERRQRSDSMILCSFNTKTNTITMISFLRDTYVSIPGYWPEKLNAAYCFGGPNTLDQTLAVNFGVHVDANVVVDFEGFKGVIDMLGGVDISLTEKEAKHLNSTRNWNLKAGMNHLNGEEALAYSRIRKIDMDSVRAQRQRKVLTALINAYKDKSVGEMLTLAKDILRTGFIKTDMTSDEVLEYVKALFPMLATAKINSQQIPAENTYETMNVGELTYCKVPDLEANRKILRQIFIMG